MKRENNLSFGCLRKKGDTVVREKRAKVFLKKEAIQRTIEQVGNESKESKSKPKEIMKVKLGFENDVPLWEVTYIDDDNRYSYYYLEFKDGKFLRRYSIEKIDVGGTTNEISKASSCFNTVFNFRNYSKGTSIKSRGS